MSLFLQKYLKLFFIAKNDFRTNIQARFFMAIVELLFRNFEETKL